MTNTTSASDSTARDGRGPVAATAVRVPPTMRGRIIFLVILAGIVFLGWLGQRDIVTSHEGRVVQTARTMSEAGWPWEHPLVDARVLGGDRVLRVNPWVVPVVQGYIRLQKPPLPYWCAAFLFRTIGFNETAARLTPALMGAIATFLLFGLATRLYGERTGWLAALVWVSTMFIAQEYRMAMADPQLAFFTLLCVWAWVGATHRDESNSSGGIKLLIFYLSLALGVLAKGPLIFVHVGIALACYHVCFRKRPPKLLWSHLSGLIVFVVIALPWPLAVLRALPQAREIWWAESVAQLSEVSDQHRPWHFYLPQWLLMALPWTPVLIWGVVLRLRRGRTRRTSQSRPWFPLMWFVLTVVFFSFANMKKNAYLLPAAPALVIVTAQALATTLAWLRRERFAKGAGVLAIALGLIGLGCAAATFVYAARAHAPNGVAAAMVAAMAAMQPLLFWRGKRVDAWRWVARQAFAFAIVLCVYENVWRAGRENDRSPRAAGELASQIAAGSNGTVGLPVGLPHAAVYVPTQLACPPGGSPTVILTEADGAAPVAASTNARFIEVGIRRGPWRVWQLVRQPATRP